MTDRFKFRVYIKYAKMMCYDVNGFYIDRLKNKITIYFDDGHTKTFKFDDVVLEQSTGLKDKNGKLIYEGDILKIIQNEWVKNKKYKPFWTVEYKNFSGELGFRVYGKNRRFNTRLSENVVYNSQAVVVGNIHENKELLDE